MPPNENYTDKQLLEKVATGDQRAFAILFDRYKERFYWLALKLTGSATVAEDIVQETFMSIWQKQATLHDIDNPPAYFFTVVYRKIYSYFNKLTLDRKLQKVVAPLTEGQNTTDENILARETSRLIAEAISGLPPQQQRVIQLSRELGLSREEIAREMGISPNTVKNHLAEALQTLRTSLDKAHILVAALLWFWKD